MQSVPSMKTDSNSLGTDIAALLRNEYIADHPSKLVHYHIQDT